MNALDFLQLIQPTDGYLIAWCKKADAKPLQRVFEETEEMLSWLRKRNEEGWDTYHAPATFKDRRGTLNVATGKYEHPRGQANVSMVGALFGDVDTKESHATAHYASRVEAFNAVCDFCRAAGLPYPLFVDSGGGIHFYWPLDEDLDPVEWSRLANALKLACIHYKLDADHRLTANSAAVLRTPGLLHQRLQRIVTVGEPTRLYSVAEFAHLLKDFPPHEHIQTISASARVPNANDERTVIGKLSRATWDAESDPNTLVRNCVQIARVIRRPDSAREPLHRLVIGTFKHCGERGEQFYLGSLAPEWREVGRAKFERWNTGPPFCASFELENPGGCAGCRFFDASKKGLDRFRFKSAVHAGRIVPSDIRDTSQDEAPNSAIGTADGQESATKEINGTYLNGARPKLSAVLSGIKIPKGYIFDKEQRLVIPHEDSSGNPQHILISDQPLYLASVHKSEAGSAHGTTLCFRQWNPYDGWFPINVPAGDFQTATGLSTMLNAGANIYNPTEFRKFVQMSVDMLTHETIRTPRYEQYGWKKDARGKREGFLLGTTMIGHDTVTEVPVNDELNTRSRWIGPVPGGNLLKWREIVAQLIPPLDHAGWFTILVSIGSIFMSWLSEHESGGVMNNRELNSGTGKTSRMHAACSVWARWEGLRINNYDTGPSQGYMRASICHLPTFHDELALQAKAKEPTMLRDYLQLLTEGCDRRRMLPGGKGLQYSQGEWSNTELSGSNHSLPDLLRVHGGGTDAPIMRCLEVTSRTDSHLTAKQHEDLKNEMWKHSGWAGYTFLWHLINEHMELAEKKLHEWSQWIYANTNLKQKHRFWVRQIVSAAVAGEICELHGILPIDDFRTTITWVLNDIAALTSKERDDEVPSGGDGVEALAQFFSANVRNVLAVNGPFMPGIAPIKPLQQPNELVIRYEQGNQRLFFPSQTLRIFCVQRGFIYSDCIKGLLDCKFMLHKDKFVSLGAGTTVPSTRTRCVELDMSHPLAMQLPRLVEEAMND